MSPKTDNRPCLERPYRGLHPRQRSCSNIVTDSLKPDMLTPVSYTGTAELLSFDDLGLSVWSRVRLYFACLVRDGSGTFAAELEALPTVRAGGI